MIGGSLSKRWENDLFFRRRSTSGTRFAVSDDLQEQLFQRCGGILHPHHLATVFGNHRTDFFFRFFAQSLGLEFGGVLNG